MPLLYRAVGLIEEDLRRELSRAVARMLAGNVAVARLVEGDMVLRSAVFEANGRR
jgi:hypothetical protein